MEQTEKKPGSGKRTREQILQIIAQYKKAEGVTVKDFCRHHGISEGSFYSFRSRYGFSNQVKDKPGGFIAITTPMLKESFNTLFAEVNGIKIYQAVPADYLKTLAS
ncbi:MAG TPA: transposase [Niastella sp.]|nr:transposase [Niastella sp.]